MENKFAEIFCPASILPSHSDGFPASQLRSVWLVTNDGSGICNDANSNCLRLSEIVELLELATSDIEFCKGVIQVNAKTGSCIICHDIAALAIPLKSYIQPLYIMSAIPFSVAGAIIGHWLTGNDLSMLSIIGVVALAGVVVNDSLVLVDFINQKVSEGEEKLKAVVEAGQMRFRAVILTSLTTFLGLLPIQLETSIQAQFIKPMATSVGFGILFATAVTLFLVPILFFIAHDISQFFAKRLSPKTL